MKYITLIIFAAMSTTMVSCNTETKQTQTTDFASNPFSKESTLPFLVPDFTKINDNDFEPAFDEGIKQQMEEVNKIANNPEAPTFENTLVELEKSGSLLTRVNGVFNLLASANTNEHLQKVSETIAPKLAANRDAIYLNSKLFKRVETIYNDREKLNLDAESKRLVEYYYQKFELAGAKLSDADKSKLKALNQEEASLSAKFTNMLVNGAKAAALVVSDSSELAGLSAGTIAAAWQNAQTNKMPGKYLISLQNTTQQPDLQFLSNRTTRQKLFENSWTRTEKKDSNDTRSTISRIAQIRVIQANLLGFPNYASWRLKDQMAKTPDAVENFLNRLIPAATAKALNDAKELQQVIDRENGGFKLEAYDWEYYAEKVRKEKYNLDDNEVKPYFVLDSVLKNGVFYAANLLYGLGFVERHDIPVYQKDVRVFEVHDKDNSIIGLFYCDYFKRDNKSGGAWMDNIVGQSTLLGTKPVIYNVCNFTKPADGEPALISFDDVTTMFHEFGHALHGFFASQKYPSLSGTNVARDFVEFPSQFNEHWAIYPEIFKNYAINYKTGEPMPQTLVDKIKKAATFNQGYGLTELLSAASLDMQWHTIGSDSTLQNVDTFEINALKRTKLNLSQVPPRYRSSYFLHIWSNGYAAAYYAYLWTEMLDDDAYSWFEQNGGLTRENGQRFRDMILSRGNTMDLAVMFKAFRGSDPNIEPMLKDRGLK